MESWTYGDALCYALCTILLFLWHMPLLTMFTMLYKLPLFLLIELPYGVLAEFKVHNFDRRNSSRSYDTFFQFASVMFTRWVLSNFDSQVIRKVFFSSTHAHVLHAMRRFKYGTDNIGDCQYYSVTLPVKGYWVRSKSRVHQNPDFVIYFVPGNLAGCASSYLYVEFLCMLLKELQVEGFRNPAIFCVDTNYFTCKDHGFEKYVSEVLAGWQYASTEYKHAKTLVMGSGVGATALLSVLLHIARPHAGILPRPVNTTPEEKFEPTVPAAEAPAAEAGVTNSCAMEFSIGSFLGMPSVGLSLIKESVADTVDVNDIVHTGGGARSHMTAEGRGTVDTNNLNAIAALIGLAGRAEKSEEAFQTDDLLPCVPELRAASSTLPSIELPCTPNMSTEPEKANEDEQAGEIEDALLDRMVDSNHAIFDSTDPFLRQSTGAPVELTDPFKEEPEKEMHVSFNEKLVADLPSFSGFEPEEPVNYEPVAASTPTPLLSPLDVPTNESLNSVADVAMEATESATGAAAKTMESVAEPAVEPIAKPIAEIAVESVVEPAENVVEPATVHTAEPAAEPAAEPTTEPVFELIDKSITEPIAESIAEAIAEPIAEIVVEPIAEIVEPLSEHAAPVAIEIPVKSNTPAPDSDTPVAARPDGVLLVSPMMRLVLNRKYQYPDFIGKKALSRLAGVLSNRDGCLDDTVCSKPGCIHDSAWWNAAIPPRGVSVYYGGRETQRDEIERLFKLLGSGSHRRIVAACREDETHAWPITNAYTARCTTDRMDGVSVLADGIAKMLVMDCLFSHSSIVED